MKTAHMLIDWWAQNRRAKLAVLHLRLEAERLRLSKERDLARYVTALADYVEGKQ